MNRLLDLTLSYWETENCARATACGLLDFFDNHSESKTLYDALLPFGGGIGEKSICGAVCGCLAALSFKLTEKRLENEEIREKSILFKELFAEQFESLLCRELIQSFLLEDGTYSDERRNRCTEFVTEGVKLVNTLVEEA